MTDTAIIRPMRLSDLSDVIRIDCQAFEHYAFTMFNRKTQLAPRPQALVCAYLDAFPDGAFVAEVDGVLVGSIFAHSWGRIGWVGPFSVGPAYQGRGIGRRLLDVATTYLEAKGTAVIGLETMVESRRNLRFYANAGFEFESVRIRVRAPIEPLVSSLGASCRCVSVTGALNEMAADIRAVCGAVETGFDPMPTLTAFVNRAIGDVIVAVENECVGVSLVSWPGRRSERDVGHILLCVPSPRSADPDAVADALMRACLLRLAGEGCREVRIPAYGGYPRAVAWAVARGGELESVCVRMVRKGGMSSYILEPGLRAFVEWAG